MVKYHDNSWYIWANYNSLTCFFWINKAIWGWFPWNKPWFQGSGEQGSVVIIYPDPMKSPFYPCHFQFPMKSPFYPTFHHHFTQINGFDFKIQGVYSKDIPPSHQQNSPLFPATKRDVRRRQNIQMISNEGLWLTKKWELRNDIMTYHMCIEIYWNDICCTHWR